MKFKNQPNQIDLKKPQEKDPERKILNWHYTENISGGWSTGTTEEEPGFYPANDINVCDVIIAPAAYVKQHPEIRRHGFTDEIIRNAVTDWWNKKDLATIEDQYRSWLKQNVYKIEPEELRRFQTLDRIGQIGQALFWTVFEHMKRHDGHINIFTQWDDLLRIVHDSALIENQRIQILAIINALRKDTEKLEDFFHNGITNEILGKTGAKSPIKKDEASLLLLPGGLGFLVEQDAYKRAYPEKSPKGFYIRAFHNNTLVGRIFVANNTEDANATIKHEYTHLIYAKYLQPLLESVAQKDVQSYTDPEAQEIFQQMRDELSAYAAGGEYVYRETALLRGGRMSLDDRLEYVVNKSEADKLFAEWNEVKNELSTCQCVFRIAPEELLPILMTSTSFSMMRKRLFLYRENLISASQQTKYDY